MKRLMQLLVIGFITIWASTVLAAPTYNVSDGNLGLKGYDPVSYTVRGPVKGLESITATHNGVTYRFANAANLDAFNKDPDRYEPAYGGWCAWAMLDGQEVKVDPTNYKVIDGKVYVYFKNFFTNTLNKWNDLAETKGEPTLVVTAKQQYDGL